MGGSEESAQGTPHGIRRFQSGRSIRFGYAKGLL
jgi:hypothetical protein